MAEKSPSSWSELGLSHNLAQHWIRLGIEPREFALLRLRSPKHFKLGNKREADRVWDLISKGCSVKKILVVAGRESDGSHESDLCRLMDTGVVPPVRLRKQVDEPSDEQMRRQESASLIGDLIVSALPWLWGA
jgi:hypothetical protein